MTNYLTPDRDGYSFTANNHYKIKQEYGGMRYLVENDAGVDVIVRADGKPSARLDWGGKFHRCSDLLNEALNIHAKAEALAIRENVRSIVGNAIKSNDFWKVRGKGWRIQKEGAEITSNGFVPADLKYNHNGKVVSVKEACELLYELQKVLRCSDWSELKMQAQVSRTLADALVKLQNSTNC